MTTQDDNTPATGEAKAKQRPRGRWKRLHWSLRAGVYCAVLLLVYTLVGFFAVPPLAKNAAVSGVRDNLGRTARIGEIRFNPFTLRAEIDDFALLERDEHTVFASWDRLVVDLSGTSLFRLAGVLELVQLEGPYVRVVVEAPNQYNFSDILLAALGEDDGTGGQATDESTPQEDGDSGPGVPLLLENLVIHGGGADIQDNIIDKSHTIRSLDLTLPFASTLPEDADQFLTPHLAAVINGRGFHMGGQTKPFADSMRTEFDFALKDVDLAQYWAYVPLPAPVQLADGRMDLTGSLFFEMPEEPNGIPEVYVSADLGLRDVRMAKESGDTFLSLERFDARLERFDLRERTITLGELRLTRPSATLARLADGSIDWTALLPADAETDDDTDAEAVEEKEAPTHPPYIIRAARFVLDQGTVRFTDQAVTPSFATKANLDVEVTDISTAPGEVWHFAVNATADKGESLGLDGALSLWSSEDQTLALNGTVALSGAALPAYAPYYRDALPLRLTKGTLGAGAGFEVVVPRTDGEADAPSGPQVRVHDISADLASLALSLPNDEAATDPALALNELAVRGGLLDLAAHSLTIPEVAIHGLAMRAERDQEGIVDVAAALAGDETKAEKAEEGASTQTSETADPEQAPETPWAVRVDKLALDDAAVHFRDRAVPSGARYALAPLSLEVLGFDTDFATPFQVKLGTALAADDNAEAGSLDATAEVVLAPLSAKGDVHLAGLTLDAANAYLPDSVPLLPAHGTAELRGAWRLDPPEAEGDPNQAAFQGDLALRDLRMDARSGIGFASVESVDLNGIDLDTAPLALRAGKLSVRHAALLDPDGGGHPLDLGTLTMTELDARPGDDRYGATSVALDGFQADIVLTPGKGANVGRAFAGLSPQSEEAEEAPEESTPEPQPAAGTPEPDTAETAQAPQTQQTPKAPLPRITLGGVTLDNSDVSFRDESLSPAFTAHLTDLKLAMERFDTRPDTPDDPASRSPFELHAVLDGHAPLSLTGAVAAHDATLGTEGTLNLAGLDMTALSPYTRAFIAYPVATGKLFADVGISITGAELAGENVFRIEDLNFGDKIDNPDAASVPVDLALALLKDQSGVMKLDIPVQGRLDDPQFRLGRVIFRAITNLFLKVVTAPFAILGNLVGGSEESGYLVFEPGRAILGPTNQQKLDTLAEALAKRPGIKLELSGYAEPETDRAALHKARFQALLKQAKYRILSEEGQEPAEAAALTITPEERPMVLEQAWLDADVPKEKNFLGIVKDQDPAVMEAALREYTAVSDAEIEELAAERSRAARTYLIESKGIDPERLFLHDTTGAKPSERPGVSPRRVDMAVR